MSGISRIGKTNTIKINKVKCKRKKSNILSRIVTQKCGGHQCNGVSIPQLYSHCFQSQGNIQIRAIRKSDNKNMSLLLGVGDPSLLVRTDTLPCWQRWMLPWQPSLIFLDCFCKWTGWIPHQPPFVFSKYLMPSPELLGQKLLLLSQGFLCLRPWLQWPLCHWHILGL